MKTFHALRPVRTSAPAVTPVTVAEAKARLNVEHDDHDSMIEDMMKAAVGRVDAFGLLGAALISQTWRFDYDGFPDCDFLRLPLGPVQSAVVTYFDGANASQTFSSASYYLVADDLGPKILLDSNAVWPTTYTRPNAVSVTAVVGYGDATTDIPDPIRSAIFIMIADLYRHRESVLAGTSVDRIPHSMTVAALIEGHRRVGLS